MKIFHVDMNSFFASCEQSMAPELAGKPVIVCGDPDNRAGIVLAASYEAKAFGVKTTMLMHDAKRLCPDAVFVCAHHREYVRISGLVMAILDDFTPVKEQASIDEAYLDMTGTEGLFGDSLHAAGLIQARIHDELAIGCSIGISTNKFLAKMASDMKKPMGITELYESDVPDKLWPLPVSQLYGVGKKTAEKLEGLGIGTVGELAAADVGMLRRVFGEAAAKYLANSAMGLGSDKVDPDEFAENQSIGNEMTYSHDITNIDEARGELLFLSDMVGYRLRKKEFAARCVTIKIKYSDFKVATRSKTSPAPIDSTDAIFAAAEKLFADNWTRRPVRLLGVTVSELSGGEQLSLFDGGGEKVKKSDAVVDSLRERFGYESIERGSLLGRKQKKL